jgi:hypothetical protein
MTCIEVMPVQKNSICNLKYKNGGEIALKLQQSVFIDVSAACKVRLTAPTKLTAK